MPLDATGLRTQIADYATRYQQAHQRREDRLAQLCAPLQAAFGGADELSATCAAAARMSGLRWAGALFTAGEAINRQFPFCSEPNRYALIAADGSQITPDRHRPFIFGYVQAGCAGVVYGERPHPLTDELRRLRRSQLIAENELFDERTGELKPPAEIANRRDLLEIELLAEACCMARDAGLQPVLVADGSLVPFALLASRVPPQEFERLLRPIKAALDVMRDCDAWVCGYIDRPNSNALVRACALAGLSPEALTERALREREALLIEIFDRHALERTLEPAHRTALFDPNWEINAPHHLGEHAMRACYVNFGDAAHPIIARIEAPVWCADPPRVGALCAILHRHAQLGGGYPLVLKAAHEEAVLSKDDQQEIEQAIEGALMSRGFLPQASFKQEAKDRG